MPFLVDVDQVELRISKYLENQATKELHGGSHLVDEWASDEGITFIALILAILSCGSHFSNLSFTQRYDASREFGKLNGFHIPSNRKFPILILCSKTSISSSATSKLHVAAVS